MLLLKKIYPKLFVGVIGFIGVLHHSMAATYNLAVPPIQNKARTLQFYQPLTKYLSQATGHTINVHASNNFLSYWEELRQNKSYDMVLEPAHFTAYHTSKLGFTVLAKITDTVSLSLVSSENDVFFDAQELIGKRIATTNSPSLAGVGLFEMYPNPLRQPEIIGVDNFQEALSKLKTGEVNAALVPTSLISGDTTVNTIQTTEPVPHMAISVSKQIDSETRTKIKNALIRAGETEQGRKMLQSVNIQGFEAASNNTYEGYDRLLQDVWGY